MDRDIRFIDSDYNRLFSVPDGGKISLTYPDRENVILTCKYIDDYHFSTGMETWHICQFAEVMEHSDIKYEPAKTVAVELTTPTLSESDLLRPSSQPRGCIGQFRGEFRRSDDRYFPSWTDKTPELITDEFRSEFNGIINHLRLKTPLLQSSGGMKTYCQKHPCLKVERPGFDSYAFKAVTDKHTYYINCMISQDDCTAIVWSYNSAELEKYIKKNAEKTTKPKKKKEAERE